MKAESWNPDLQATKTASRFFRASKPRVKRTKGQILIESTPHGRIEFIYLDGRRILVAAERPPRDSGSTASDQWPEDFIEHCRQNGLRPWKIMPYEERFSDVLARLLAGDTDLPHTPAAPFVSPFATDLPEVRPIIGEGRRAVIGQLRAAMEARVQGDPLPLLWGPTGAGKRTMLARLAREDDAQGVEVSIARILIERVLQTPPESFMQFILEEGDRLGRFFAVFSATEWLTKVSPLDRLHTLTELSRLPRVALISDHALGRLLGAQCIPLACPCLGREDCAALIAAECPGLDVAEAALDMMAKAAWEPGFGVIPGRLLFLTRLAQSLSVSKDKTAAAVIRPDDLAPALALFQSSAGKTGVPGGDDRASPIHGEQ